jgi:hypothetical protein
MPAELEGFGDGLTPPQRDSLIRPPRPAVCLRCRRRRVAVRGLYAGRRLPGAPTLPPLWEPVTDACELRVV